MKLVLYLPLVSAILVVSKTQRCPGEEEQILFTNGDILLVGMFNVHLSGNGPFDCGSIKPQGVQLLEAFNYAINVINAKRDRRFSAILPGVRLGGVGLDACETAIRAGTLVANLQSRAISLQDTNNRTVDPAKVAAYIGAFTSKASLQIANVLNELTMPQISFGASSLELKNALRYGTFLRTVPADDRQARAIVAILKRFDLRYVQIVASPGITGQQAADRFMREALDANLCVAQNVSLGLDSDVTASEAEAAVETLLKKPAATAVVTFLATPHVNLFLRALGDVMQRRGITKRPFQLIGSATWGNNMALISNVGNLAADAITLGVETTDIPAFDDYLARINPQTYQKNPWFREYYEDLMQCSFGGNTRFAQRCDQRSVVRAPGYAQDPYVLYVVNAVFSAARGLHEVLMATCGRNYNGVCSSFQNNARSRQRILDAIKNVTFNDATQKEFRFENGESNRGYHLYTVKPPQAGRTSYFYENIGNYNDTHRLKIDSTFSVNWKSDCSGPRSCSECPQLGLKRSRFMQVTSPENLNVVAFFNVHQSRSNDPLRCGRLDDSNGFQNLLALFYAISRINSGGQLNLSPSIKLGALAVDTCGSEERMRKELVSLLGDGVLCSLSRQGSLVQSASTWYYMTTGSQSTLAAADLLTSLQLNLISPDSSEPAKRDYFLSTQPDLDQQTAAMLEIIRRLGWSHVRVVNSNDVHGRTGSAAFVRGVRSGRTGLKRLCVAGPGAVSLPPRLTLATATELVQRWSQDSNGRAIVLFTNSRDTQMLFQAARAANLQGRFVWLGSTQIGDNPQITTGLEDIARGAIFLRGKTDFVRGFLDYVTTLTVAEHGAIPNDWFDEFWQNTLRCRLENSTMVQMQYSRLCADQDRISRDQIRVNPSVLHTILATHMIAIGLNNVQQCRGNPNGVSGCLSRLQNAHSLIFNSTKASTWNVMNGEISNPFQFSFTSNGTGNWGFEVLNFRQNNGLNYEYVKLGEWRNGNFSSGGLSGYRGYNAAGERTPPQSSACLQDTQCNCMSGTGVDAGPVSGTQSPEAAMPTLTQNFSMPWGIVLAALSALGIIATLFLFIYLIIVYPVKGATSVLGFLLLFGVLCLYTLNFAFILHANIVTCSIRKFCLGQIYALCFACMLVKVLNTWRIGNPSDNYSPATYERLSSPVSLFFIALFIAGVQTAIAAEWLILIPTTSTTVNYNGSPFPVCAPANGHYEQLVQSCVYVMLLLLLTLCFALVTWDSEESARESRWILVTSCFSVVIWIVWATVCIVITELRYKDPAIAIGNLANATVILLCLFFRKIYLLNKLEKEEKMTNNGHLGGSMLYVVDDPDNNGPPQLYAVEPQMDTLERGSVKAGSTAGSGLMYVYDNNRGADVEL